MNKPTTPTPTHVTPYAGSDAFEHIGLLNDYVRIPYANGSSFAAQFLYREFMARGHRVTVVGPEDPDAQPEEMPARYVCLPSLPLRNHPGVYMPVPTPGGLSRVAAQRFDVVIGQAASEFVELGTWLRWKQHVPFLAVTTIHLPSVYNVLLPDQLLAMPQVDGLFRERIIPWIEGHSAHVYNQTDGLIVLSEGLRKYWQDRGVTAPIHVIPRSVDPKIFDRQGFDDPFPAHFPRGGRLLTVCRHTREKNVERLLTLFARHIAPKRPDATLTLVGDGPDHDAFKAHAERLGIGERCYFPGEFPLTEIPGFYEHADQFVYTSLSETYGQVISEAMWCGLPVVAFADGMGVSDQIHHGVDGLVVSPGPDAADADEAFAAHVTRLLSDAGFRRALRSQASAAVRRRAHPARCIDSYYETFESARRHCHDSQEARIAHPFATAGALARWTTVQSLLFGLGLVRPPVTVNRHGRKQPTWDALMDLQDAVAQQRPRPSARRRPVELVAVR